MNKIIFLGDKVTVEDCLESTGHCISSTLFNDTFLNSLTTFDSDFIDFLKTLYYDFSIDYEMNRFNKILSPLYRRIYIYYQELLDSGAIVDYTDAWTKTNLEFRNIFVKKFFENWQRQFLTIFADYNPINNYDMTETNDETTFTKTNTDMKSETTDDGKVVNSFYGFNSNTAKAVNESQNSGGPETTTTGLSTKNDQNVDNDYTLTRSGNIGVTTTQQMIEAELKLRRTTFLDIISRDMDSLLFLDYYI